MESTFERYWEHAQWSTQFTTMLLMPPPPHVIDLLTAASRSSGVANMFACALRREK